MASLKLHDELIVISLERAKIKKQRDHRAQRTPLVTSLRWLQLLGAFLLVQDIPQPFKLHNGSNELNDPF
jgi:hypothetical protein